MRDDIDNLLKQYLPLDGNQGVSKNGGKTPGTETNTNLRLIGSLDDSAGEPADL